MNTDFFDFIPNTVIQTCHFINRQGEKIAFQVKRDDLVDSQISGNKWRKLKYNFSHLVDSNYRGIASFGGAFSNHIAALAAAGNNAGVRTLGFIRCHQIDLTNPTLQLAKANGMKLVPVSREQYRNRQDAKFIAQLQQAYPDYFFVPEGGSNAFAHLGLKELAKEIEAQTQVKTIACAIGSGGTIAGLMAHLPNHHFIGVAAVNDQALLNRLQQTYGDRLTVTTSALFGGYGKTNETLNQFCFEFSKQTKIPIEPIYTGKLFYALCEQRLSQDNDVLAIHTGGLQGLKGLSYRRQCPPYLWQQVASLLDV